MTDRKKLKWRLFRRDGWRQLDPETGRSRWVAMCSFGCGEVLTYETATIDHYPIPRRLGGNLSKQNTRLACHPCNTRDGGPAGAWSGVVPHGLAPLERRQWWQQELGNA